VACQVDKMLALVAQEPLVVTAGLGEPTAMPGDLEIPELTVTEQRERLVRRVLLEAWRVMHSEAQPEST